MASDVHSDTRSRVAGSPRFRPWPPSTCGGGTLQDRDDHSARRRSSVSRQTSRAGGGSSCAHSSYPQTERLFLREMLAVRWSGKIPRWPRQSGGEPPVPPPARDEGDERRPQFHGTVALTAVGRRAALRPQLRPPRGRLCSGPISSRQTTAPSWGGWP